MWFGLPGHHFLKLFRESFQGSGCAVVVGSPTWLTMHSLGGCAREIGAEFHRGEIENDHGRNPKMVRYSTTSPCFFAVVIPYSMPLLMPRSV